MEPEERAPGGRRRRSERPPVAPPRRNAGGAAAGAELANDARRPPAWVRTRDLRDDGRGLRIETRAPRPPAATLPAPVAAPGRPVPAHDRRRLHDLAMRAPPNPFLSPPGPTPPVPIAQRRSASGSLEHRVLVPQRPVLQDQILPGSSGQSQPSKEDPQHEPHANPPQAGERVAEPLLSGKPLADRGLAPYRRPPPPPCRWNTYRSRTCTPIHSIPAASRGESWRPSAAP